MAEMLGYHADGTGRDTYIRRDPVVSYGKREYRVPPAPITRMGTAGATLSRDRATGYAGFVPGETIQVCHKSGLLLGERAGEENDPYMTTAKRAQLDVEEGLAAGSVQLDKHMSGTVMQVGYQGTSRCMPEQLGNVRINQFTTMKELMQDRMITSCQMPEHLAHLPGYKGHRPRYPRAENSSMYSGGAQTGEVAMWQSIGVVADPPRPANTTMPDDFYN